MTNLGVHTYSGQEEKLFCLKLTKLFILYAYTKIIYVL